MLFESGLMNCHVQGLHSLVISKKSDGSMFRVYFADQGHAMGSLLNGDGQFSLAPHNHRYPLTMVLLHGTVVNWKVLLSTTGMRVNQFEFKSALHGGDFELTHLGTYRIAFEPKVVCQLTLPSSDIHSVTVSSPTASWLICEHPSDRHSTHFYSRNSDQNQLSRVGLYEPMNQPQLLDYEEKLRARISEGRFEMLRELKL